MRCVRSLFNLGFFLLATLLSSKPPGSVRLCSSKVGVTDACCMPTFGLWGFELRFSGFHGKYFILWPISPAPDAPMLWRRQLAPGDPGVVWGSLFETSSLCCPLSPHQHCSFGASGRGLSSGYKCVQPQSQRLSVGIIATNLNVSVYNPRDGLLPH